MIWIGLTGGIGSGKSTVAQYLRQRGYQVIDADQLAHRALNPGTNTFQEIVEIFGKGILSKDGTVDRKKLGSMVFKDPTKLARLEFIVHPFVQLEAERERKKLATSQEFAFYDVPLLFEKKLEKKFDQIWVVALDPETQISRLKKRNSWSEEEIQSRISAQLPLSEKVARADVVIRNDGTLAELEERIEDVVAQMLLAR
jgi:dephospho-CoA kinase